jgi:sulfite exporter TauE/SafE
MMHGTAGSAPLLALIPVVSASDPAIGMAYLVTFSFGVFLAMLMVGWLLGWLLRWSAVQSSKLLTIIQGVAGFAALGYGFHLIAKMG